MSRYDPVAGIDYLVDHYEILGVAKTATLGEITSAWRDKLKQYHPDKFQGLAPELLGKASYMTELLNEAYSVLKNSEKRSAFDVVLAGWVKPISKDGTAIVDLNSRHFSLASLLKRSGSDREKYIEDAKKTALQFSNFSQATYTLFETMAESPTGIPETHKVAYMEQLAIRDLYLTLYEGLVWENAGMHNHSTDALLNYKDATMDNIATLKEQALGAVTDEILLLATGEKALLGAPEGMSVATHLPVIHAHNMQVVVNHLEHYAQLIESLASEREGVLKKRFTNGALITYHPQTIHYTKKLVVELKTPKGSKWFCFELDDSTIVQGMHVDGVELVENVSIALQWMSNGYTILSFILVPDIDIESQLEEVINLHKTKISDSH